MMVCFDHVPPFVFQIYCRSSWESTQAGVLLDDFPVPHPVLLYAFAKFSLFKVTPHLLLFLHVLRCCNKQESKNTSNLGGQAGAMPLSP